MNKIDKSTSAWDLVKHYIQPVAPYLDMPGVTEILIDRYDRVYIEKHGHFEETPVKFKDNSEVEKLIRQIATALDQTVDNDHFPILDARLPGSNGRIGARINAVMTPVSVRGACITIRVFPLHALTANDLLELGAFTHEMLEFLRLAVLCRRNILVSGGTGSGKTTLINMLCGFIQKGDRIVVIEDTSELEILTDFLISMEAPKRKIEHGRDAQLIDMSFLLRNALRQRPDRIIVGEIRSADAAASFLQAINTGHEGCMTTLHANSTLDALNRMEGLVAAQNSGLPYDVIKSQVRGNVNLLIQQQRIPGYGKRIVEIAEFSDNQFRLLCHWDYKNHQHVMDFDLQNSKVAETARRYGIVSDMLS